MDEQKLYVNIKLSNKTVFDLIDNYLKQRYDIVFNIISHEYLIKFKDSKKWKVLNENSLRIELTKKKIKFKKDDFYTYLGSNYIKQFNPLKEYFKNLNKWDEIDHIKKLISYIPTDDNIFFEYHLKKWLARTVKTALEEDFYNKQCIVFVQVEQNSGKSTLCRFLCPPELKKHIAENISDDRDGLVQLCKNLLINLDEIDKLSAKYINAYKSMFSKTHINIRLPYAKHNSHQTRNCSFIGSTNLINFLKDETGNVRWVCIELIGQIDFNYSKDIDINKVWEQAFHLAYKDEAFNCDLTVNDIKENEKRNANYKQSTIEEDLINQLFEKSDNRDHFMTTTTITMIIKKEYSSVSHIAIGKVLRKLKFKRINSKITGVKGYLIKLRKK
ncbi:virulence-associated E family protein [Polaribacter haliotis]|uniref:Virulence-associated E family protein n=2 Tax=Polaribacter TaxID=52959 RepID=A0A7L8AGE1_9FLAO|nr:MULTISPECIES: VapE domain-containing protein [Polaribacter]MDD7914089.1 VapE family protein [Polaribacter sp. MSW5]QOD61030.1 virulence-associated E family protein [Polaribacter haliotis]